MSTQMIEPKAKNPERKSLKAWPETHRRVRLIQRSMADPETFKEPSQEVILAKAIDALERERRLSQSAPIAEKSHFNSLTLVQDSEKISVPRPEDRDYIEKLLAILGSGDDAAIKNAKRRIDVLYKELEGEHDVSVVKPKGKEVSG